jgi:HEAT repeat protein
MTLARIIVAALAIAPYATSVAAASEDLAANVLSSDGWVAYRVPMVQGAGAPCCYTAPGAGSARKVCNLDERNRSFTIADDEAVVDDTLAVYIRVHSGTVEQVRALAASCPVRTASTVRWLEHVDPAQSVAMLSRLMDRDAGSNADDLGLMALAYHADPAATRSLATRAERSHPDSQREGALFWLAQARGMEGADLVAGHATSDPDPDIRAHAVFALSQSSATDAYPRILNVARRDSSEDVRGKSLFWLAQMDDPRARHDIMASLAAESSEEVREQAVFALSQLEDEAADDALIAVLGGDYPRSVKKHALFWLGQSGSSRALAYFERVLQ